MKKLQLLFVLILMIILCSCGKKEKTIEGETMEITLFSFTHTGMSTEECFLYSAEQTENGIRLYTEELFSGGLIVDKIVDEPVLEQLSEIANKYHLDKWDGFDKKNKHVMDGSDFSLSVTLADGKTISAHGSKSFPDGFADVEREIRGLFEDLIDRYGNRYPKTLESDELDYIFLTLRRKTDAGDEHFEVSVGCQPDDRISLNIWINGYSEFYPAGQYPFFDGYCESFPFDEFQSIIREYDVPSWNGWNKTVEGCYEEWIQMKLGYASGEEISVMGSLFPEKYAFFRNAFLKAAVKYIEENSGEFSLN
ncbi:MAG: hypothetical protein E7287_10040 [Lachnospiraceae bacterium]|nr:hypothetical protein [Lachnospiraceae bacterium]